MISNSMKEKINLEKLLTDSPKENFSLTTEDKEWIYAKPMGKEHGSSSKQM